MTRWQITRDSLDRDTAYVLGSSPCQEILEAVCPSSDGLRVLESGCGTGKFGMVYALKAEAHVTLLDLDPTAIEYSKALYGHLEDISLRFRGTVEWRVGNMVHLPYPDNHFNFVFNEQVLQTYGGKRHDSRRQKTINEMARVCSKVVCAIVPNVEEPSTAALEASLDRTLYPNLKYFTTEEICRRLWRAGLEGVRHFYIASEGKERLLIAAWGWKS